MRRLGGLITAALGAALALALAATAQAASLSIRTDPPLWPAFRGDVSDYVVRCAGHPRIRFDVSAPSGTKVSVDGRPKRTGTFSVKRPLAVGQRISFVVKKSGKSRTYNVRCLPKDFPAWKYTRPGKPSQPFYIVTPAPFVTPGAPAPAGPFVVVFDARGVPIWWVKSKEPVVQDGKLFADRTIGWYAARNSFLGAPKGFEIHRLDGSLVRYVKAYTARADEPVATDIHDFVALPNGDYMLLGYKRRAGTVDMTSCGGPSNAVVIDNVIQQIRPGAAKPVWSWDTKDHIALSETGRWCRISNIVPLPEGGYAYDIIHMNDLQVVGGDLVISARHTDSAYKIDYPLGTILWKLGGTPTIKSLDVSGDRFMDANVAFAGPHFARQLGDGSVTVHDNGTLRHRPPRAVRYAVNETTRTASLLEEIFLPKTESICCGSSQKLADGAWLMSWGGIPVIEELTPGGARRFTLTLPKDWYSYRVFPVPAGRVTRAALRSGMDAMHPRG